jgi:tRNA (guanine-N7-)-methyltransferase
MRKRYRQHVNPLKMTSLVPRQEPLDLPDGPAVEVDLGCGDARFLIERARSHPDRLFVGLDIREEFLQYGLEEVARLELDNVQLCTSNLIVDLEQMFDDGRVHRFHINFPDPWFKARQHNRRWLDEQSLDHLVRSLEEGGELFFQSDVWSLTIEALSLLEANPGLYNACGEWTFLRESPFEERSSRELACLEAKMQIWRLLFVREVEPDPDLED